MMPRNPFNHQLMKPDFIAVPLKVHSKKEKSMWACPAGLKSALSGRAFRSVAAAEKRRQATRLQSLTQKHSPLRTDHEWGMIFYHQKRKNFKNDGRL